MMTRGGKRPSSGAPRKPYHLKKVPVNVKLPRWLIAWMRTQPGSRAMQIEDAIREMHNISEAEEKDD